MLINILLYGAGIYFLFLAAWFSMRQVERTVYTARTFSDFSGDVQSWLRSTSE